MASPSGSVAEKLPKTGVVTEVSILEKAGVSESVGVPGAPLLLIVISNVGVAVISLTEVTRADAGMVAVMVSLAGMS